MKKRIILIKKYVGKKEKPTKEELQRAYGYLDYCGACGKPFKKRDYLFNLNYSHGTMGSFHKRCPKGKQEGGE